MSHDSVMSLNVILMLLNVKSDEIMTVNKSNEFGKVSANLSYFFIHKELLRNHDGAGKGTNF